MLPVGKKKNKKKPGKIEEGEEEEKKGNIHSFIHLPLVYNYSFGTLACLKSL